MHLFVLPFLEKVCIPETVADGLCWKVRLLADTHTHTYIFPEAK